MKQVIYEEERCPHCKRHCSLKAPKCGKGKALAEKRRKEGKKAEKAVSEKAELTAQASEALDLTPYHTPGLPALLETVCQLMVCSRQGKMSSKRLRRSLLASLADGGEAGIFLPLKNREHALKKLEGQGLICRTAYGADEGKIILTDKGLEKAREEKLTPAAADPGFFSHLTEEEAKTLETILIKVLNQ